jgi:hypothetical protein
LARSGIVFSIKNTIDPNSRRYECRTPQCYRQPHASGLILIYLKKSLILKNLQMFPVQSVVIEKEDQSEDQVHALQQLLVPIFHLKKESIYG